MKSKLQLVGKIKEAHGLKGELYVLIFSGETEWLPKVKSLHLSSDEGQSFTHLALKKTRAHKQGFIALSDQVTDRNQAEAIKGQWVYVEAEHFTSSPGENIYLSEVQGFEVIDQKHGSLGVISAFRSNSVQDLIVIEKSGEEVAEVPLVEPFIERIDFENQKIYMILPEGLIGLTDDEKEPG